MADVQITDDEDEKSAAAAVKDADDGFDDISQKDDGYIKLVLRVLARMCDGQHSGLQASVPACHLMLLTYLLEHIRTASQICHLFSLLSSEETSDDIRRFCTLCVLKLLASKRILNFPFHSIS